MLISLKEALENEKSLPSSERYISKSTMQYIEDHINVFDKIYENVYARMHKKYFRKAYEKELWKKLIEGHSLLSAEYYADAFAEGYVGGRTIVKLAFCAEICMSSEVDNFSDELIEKIGRHCMLEDV